MPEVRQLLLRCDGRDGADPCGEFLVDAQQDTADELGTVSRRGRKAWRCPTCGRTTGFAIVERRVK